MANYLAAKTRLFGELLSAEGTAVLNADDPSYDMLAALCRRRGQRVLSYGRSGKELRLLALHPAAGRLDLVFELFGRSYSIKVALSGTFQALNLLAALGLVLAESTLSPEDVLATLPNLTDVPGRAELIGESPSGGQVFVDYAHTPDALETVLGALRPHTENRMVVVFGCGGDRDPGKRPLMGNIAGRLADVVIVTDDNPRSEDAATIRAEILAAIPEASEIGDRAAAIAAGIAELGPGDTLVIAGKGHETGQLVGGVVLPFDDQLVGGVVLPFDDRVVARSELERLRREEL
jgi:UDP-N-acetylmuramoyl-L-alanyl-D-glutamate--2,6-diaminopimelate ligase